MELQEPIVSPATYFAPSKLLAASIDGYVYCVHETNGDEFWKFSTGEAISQSPIPIGESVYAVTDKGSMFCLDQKTGAEKWWAPQIKRFVAASKDRLYCLGHTGRLVILDAKTGGRMASLGTEVLDIFYPNTDTDRILVATKTGVIQCLRETELQWPLVHVNLAEIEKQKRPEIKQEGLGEQAKPEAQPGEAQPGAAKPPAGEDPFGAPAAGAAPAAEPPAGGAPADAADPFGAPPAAGAAPPAGGQGGAAPPAADPFGDGAAPPAAGAGQGGAGDAPAAAGEDPFK
jgi:hypothetical protein